MTPVQSFPLCLSAKSWLMPKLWPISWARSYWFECNSLNVIINLPVFLWCCNVFVMFIVLRWLVPWFFFDHTIGQKKLIGKKIYTKKKISKKIPKKMLLSVINYHVDFLFIHLRQNSECSESNCNSTKRNNF